MENASVQVGPVWTVPSHSALEFPRAQVMEYARMTHASVMSAGPDRTVVWRAARWCPTAPGMGTVLKGNASAKKAGKAIFATLKPLVLATVTTVAFASAASVTAAVAMVALLASVRNAQPIAPDTAFA